MTVLPRKQLSYFKEVIEELKKVSWTSREELKTCTKVVLVSVFLFGLLVYGIDLGIRGILDLIYYLTNSLVG